MVADMGDDLRTPDVGDVEGGVELFVQPCRLEVPPGTVMLPTKSEPQLSPTV